MQLLRKISVSSLNNAKGGFKDIKEKTFVGRIYGTARSHMVEDKGGFGPSLKFNGEFKGVNMDGEISMSPVLYLVGPVDEMLKSAIDDLPEGAKGVEFGFDIYVTPDPANKFGYSYRVETLVESKPSEPLAALENSLSAKPLPIKPKQAPLALEGAATAATPAAETPAPTATEKPAETAAATGTEKPAANGKKK